jgi:hypothetical protein
MSLFCCSNIKPYRPQVLQHEADFRPFLEWAAFPRESLSQLSEDGNNLADLGHPTIFQLVKQVNFGPLESKRYFVAVRAEDANQTFMEATEAELIEANYEKMNA